MQRGVHREGKAEQGEPRDEHEIGPQANPAGEQRGNDEGDHRQPQRPEPRGGNLARQAVGAAPDEGGRGRLDEPIADRPERQKRADHGEGPARGVEEDGHADDEPDVARAEQRDARQGQQVHGAVLGEEFAGGFARFRLAQHRRQGRDHAEQDQPEHRGHRPERAAKAQSLQQEPAEEEADALHRVLRAGEPGDPAEQPALRILGAGGGFRHLDRRFRGRLGQVLGDAADALRQHDPGDGERRRPVRRERRQQQEAEDLGREPDREHAGDAVTGREPAADQVGGDARRLVEQEQEGQREGRIAQTKEVQQHEHAQRAVRQGETPIGGGDDGVVARACGHGLQMPTASRWQARSIMRQA